MPFATHVAVQLDAKTVLLAMYACRVFQDIT
jgi:hypothetical protein